MKLTLVAPLALLVTGLACTPSSNRGPTVGAANDAPSDAPSEWAAHLDDSQPGAASEALAEAPPTARKAPPEVARPAPRPIAVPSPAGPYGVRIVGASMRDLPTYYHDGRRYVLGTRGERYAVVISNPTPRRVEAVISIDGLDAVDGTTADYVSKRGYILPAYGNATIEGFRTSLDDVATFRFSSVAESYAGRLGQARDVGVIGVAFFPERAPIPAPPPPPPVAVSPSDDWGSPGGWGGSTHSPSRSVHPSPRIQSDSAPAAGATPSPKAAGGVAEEPAGAGAAVGDRRAEQRKGLGTEFGEARASHVDETLFVRANATSPSEIVAVRYNDRAGLQALGIRVDPPVFADTELRTRETADPFRSNRFASPPP